MKLYRHKHKQSGFSLIETIVGMAVFLVIAVGVYQSFLGTSRVIDASRARTVAASIINDDIEVIRNLQYQDIGIKNGFPAGILERSTTTTRGGFQFSIVRTIRNIDDSFDGTIGGNPNDTAPADYRLVEIEVTCTNCANFSPIRETTTAAPENLEISSGGGALFIRVVDANGNGVSQANVHIENHKLTPDLIIDDVTDSNGTLQLVDILPSTGGYHSSATKAGYSYDETYPPGNSQNPNPVKEDSTVQAGQVTQVTFAIDRVSALNISTTNEICSAISSVDVKIDGSKLIGTNPNTLKFSTIAETDVNGLLVLQNLEWDTYQFNITDLEYDLVGSIPLLPLNLPPNSSQNVQLLLEATNPKSLLVTVKDGQNNLPLTGASVTLEKSGFSETAITGKGSLSQTNWSGGSGQVEFIDQTRYAATDGNVNTTSPTGEIRLKKIGGDYQTSGWLESSYFDTGSQSNYQNLIWQPQSQPVSTSVKLQIATSNDPLIPWNFVGPDGTGNSYYTISNADISDHQGKQYFKYKVFLETEDSKKTPAISDISFTYTSSCLPPGQVFFNGLASGTYELTITHPSYQTWSDTDVQINSSYQTREALLNQ